MTKLLSVAAMAGLLIASSSAVLARDGSSGFSPGHAMKSAHPNPHTRGTFHGASRFSPGHRMQLAHRNPHTRGTFHGASSFAPGHR